MRHPQALTAKDQKASTVAKILCECYFVHYGLPARIHSDQGQDFETRLIQDLMRMFGIRKSRTSTYHSQGDPQPERFIRTLLWMLGTLIQGKSNTGARESVSWSISTIVHIMRPLVTHPTCWCSFEKLGCQLTFFSVCPMNRMKQSPFINMLSDSGKISKELTLSQLNIQTKLIK